MQTDLKNKVAVVTGGTRCIGYSIAEGLLAEGATVYICGRDAATLKSALERLSGAAKDRVGGSAADMRRYEDCRRLIHEAAERFGGLDILVNNAGIDTFKPVDQFTPEEWNAVIETNLSGVFYCCREAVPFMRRRGGGYIFNISSLSTTTAYAGGSAYNASKLGLNGLTDAMMQDLRYDGIRVTCLMPGSVDTNFGAAPGSKQREAWKLTGEDIAKAVVDLYRFRTSALASRIDLRPLQPPRKT